ncbi:MAG TPA: hypothetical protein VLT61_15595 [Anaeromyxobacteraceae bacterium]|nr:hypothetical protein [Anaeromyxobacteraceae bacterium]
MLHLMVGAMGGSADFGLSFDVGMEVHRWFATYSAWSAFYGDGRVTFSGAKAGYVHPIHRVWALYGAAGGGQLHYRAPADLAPEFTADGGAITVEGGFMLDPLPLSSGFRFGVMAVIPVFTPGMPPGQEVEAPALMASVSINPVILALGLLGGKL